MNPNLSELFEGLPGADRMIEGLGDFREGRQSIQACLVRMARPRLTRAGAMAASPPSDDGAELELYQLLSTSGDPASFSRYNALVRELISFEHALDHRMSRRLNPVT
jgi:hypothetical protein